MKIKGIYTPIVTPFGKNNEIDYQSLETLLKFLLKKQIHEIVVGGTTGEYFSLNFQERIQYRRQKNIAKKKGRERDLSLNIFQLTK